MMKRAPSKAEKILIQKLVDISGKSYSLENLKVSDMTDGDMGSLYIHSAKSNELRVFSKRIAEKEFLDEDKVPIIVSLNIDQFEDLLELDVWKVDYSKVLKYP